MVLRQFLQLTLAELRLFWREPIAVFFNFIFPVFFLFLTMEVFIPADAPKEIVVNYVAPSLMVLIIASTAVFGVLQTIVSYRDTKFLKRLKASPATPLAILGGFSLANFIVTLLGIAFLAVVAMLVYGASLAGSPMVFLAGFVLAFLSLAAIFLFIPGITRSERTAIAIANIIFFPVMFFSGVMMPLDRMPDWIVNYISPLMPVTYAVELMQGLWLGTPFLDLTREVLGLLVFLGLGLVIAVRTFRWE